MRLLITGGLGFIGSNFIRHILGKYPDYHIINLDKETYAGNHDNLREIEKSLDHSGNYSFIRGDICDRDIVDSVMCKIDTVVHFAAESHVDRSIEDASSFVRTNVLGTFVLLDSALKHNNNIQRFIHISTDEVYGSIRKGAFKETDALTPSSPYSSSKAGSDLLARSYYITHKLPVIITRCTNNFGAFQYPEKLIPLFITNLLENKKVPVYGNGKNVRDWIYVEDHCKAIEFILHKGSIGEIYNIGGGAEKTNLEITKTILGIIGKNESMIEYVKDRPGHDLRYSLDCTKLRNLGWLPEHEFDEALQQTVRWYIENRWWWEKLK